MKNYVDVEGCAILLLAELEESIILNNNIPTEVILAMNDLKKALNNSDMQLGKDLNELLKQVGESRN